MFISLTRICHQTSIHILCCVSHLVFNFIEDVAGYIEKKLKTR